LFLARTKLTLKNIITFTTLLLALSAIGLLFFPSKMLGVVGVVSNDQMDFLLRASGVGVASLIPGAWALRTSTTTSPVSRAVLIGLVIYMFLSSIVDFQAYTQSVVNAAAIPSMAFRILLGIAILLLAFKDTSKK
jgi:hypothetical protein